MFFGLSKIFWSLAQPLNLLCLIGLAGLVTMIFHRAAGHAIAVFALSAIILLGVLPIGPLLLSWLERQYPVSAEVPTGIDGIIVLGGAFETHLSRQTGQIAANDQIERIFCFVSLAKANPNAKLIVSGGAGDILDPQALEGNDVRSYFDLTGFLRRDEVTYEEKSRNTYENALYSKEIAKPRSNERWAVVTSAYHMPRAVGIFAKLGWQIIPYSCDPKTLPADSVWKRLPNVAGNYVALNLALKEIIGSVVYYFTGKSAFILPKAQVPSST